MRVDLYSFVHKAQRFHLFQFSEDLGMADLANPSEAAKIAERLHHLLEHLKDHAYNENTYIHPLYKALGSVAEPFERDHHKLEGEIEKLEDLLKTKQWNDLYSHYTRFLGLYLLHLDEEESAQREILWKNYDDPMLLAVFNRFKIERPPHLAQDDFEFMLPALNAGELTRMFMGMKTSAPPHVFQNACIRASQVLTGNRWQQISKAIETAL